MNPATAAGSALLSSNIMRSKARYIWLSLIQACGMLCLIGVYQVAIGQNPTDSVMVELPEPPRLRGFLSSSGSISAAAGLNPLLEASLAEGVKEIRIWIGGGYVVPEVMNRIMIQNGRVGGERYFYWPLSPSEEDSRKSIDELSNQLENDCDALTWNESYLVCRYRIEDTTGWSGAYTNAEEEGIWTIPDEWDLPGETYLALDGAYVTIELRDQSSYRVYRYDAFPNPELSDEAQSVHKIVRAINAVR